MFIGKQKKNMGNIKWNIKMLNVEYKNTKAIGALPKKM